jgi:hypothetical protein
MSWRDGFFEIDLGLVPMPNIDPGWVASKSYPRAQVQLWTEDLAEIQRRSLQLNWTPESFERLAMSQDPRERQLAETYHKFYHHDNGGARLNHDFVKVEWVQDHYDITNGQHRIWMAKQYGLRTMPAHVSAPDQETLDRLRKDGERLAGVSPDTRSAPKPIWERHGHDSPERDSTRQR